MSASFEKAETTFFSQEEYIQQFYDNVVAFQHTLDSTGFEATSQEMRTNIVAELNNTCPFMDERVNYNGTGIMPKFDDDDNYLHDVVIHTKGDAVEAYCRGMAILPDPENPERWLIMHAAYLYEDTAMLNATVRQTREYFCYFDLNTSITRTEEIDSALGSYHYGVPDESIVEHIETYGNDIRTLVNSKEFRKLKRKKQYKRIGTLISKLESETSLRDRAMRIEAPVAYRLEARTDRNRYISVNTAESAITGLCLGFTSLDQHLVEFRPIRKKSDRPDPAAGLCLVIDAVNKDELAQPPGSVLYVPTGNGLHIQIAPSYHD